MTGAAPENLLHGAPSDIASVTNAELAQVRAAWGVWRARAARNQLRTRYFDGKVALKPLGVSLPPRMMSLLRPVMDWPEKACTSLARRSIFEGFVSPDGSEDPFDLGSVLDENRFDMELPQAILSAYKHSCSFFTVTKGDTTAGDPEVVVQVRSAEWTGGLWDRNKRALSGVLAIKAVDGYGQPNEFDMHLPGTVLMCTRGPLGKWTARREPTGIDEVAAEPITYDAQLDRPFGRSRISRSVMTIVDSALRTAAQMEIAAEHYAVPRLVVLGMVEEAFAQGRWKLAWDQVAGISRDEDGQLPSLQQLQQLTMQPLVELFRSYAARFSSATGLPLSSLGIVQDNPPSAEAMYAAEKDLINEAIYANQGHTASLKRLARKIIAVRDGSVADDARKLDVTWANPAFTSMTTAADAIVKLSAVFPWFAESEVALETAGFSRAQVTRLLADKRRAAAGGRLDALRSAAQAVATEGQLPADALGDGAPQLDEE